MEKPEMIKEWETTEINPEEIAKYLHGTLEESDDAQSDWNIHLHYGRKNPVITIKLDTALRTMHLLIHRPRKGVFITTMTDIENLDFHLYKFRGEEQCDLKIEGCGSSVMISSYGHEHYFGKKEDRKDVRDVRCEFLTISVLNIADERARQGMEPGEATRRATEELLPLLQKHLDAGWIILVGDSNTVHLKRVLKT